MFLIIVISMTIIIINIIPITLHGIGLKEVAAVYLFVFRSLMEATAERDREKLQDALRILKVERETWRQLCDKLGEGQNPDGAKDPETTAPPQLDDEETTEQPSGGFSLEA